MSATSLSAYGETSRKNVEHLSRLEGKQAGDPACGNRAIIEAVDASESPVHLVLGSDAVRRARLEKFAELDRWEQVSLSTDLAE
jgi:hypothetical protein